MRSLTRSRRRLPAVGRTHPLGLLCALVLTAACLRADAAHAALEPLDAFGGLGSGPGQLAPWASGVAVSPSGRVYVADTWNDRVQSFTPGGAAAGAFGGRGESAAQLRHPVGVAVDGAGAVYVTEADGDVHRFTADGTAIGVLGGPGSGPGRLDDPRGVAIARDGTVLVVDAGAARVRVYSPSGSVLGSWGSRGSGPGQFLDPDGIAVAPEGDVYVTDREAGRVQRFSAAGAYLDAFDGSGTAAGSLFRPRGVTVDREGTVHVADAGRNRIVTFSADGAARSWGASPAFLGLTGLAGDCRASVYVIDAGRGRIRRFGRAGAPPPPCSPPVAAFTATPATVEAGTQVLLDGSGSGDDGRITRWDWDLDGDGAFEQADRGPTLTRTFDRPGTVTVTLRVTDDDGQQAQVSRPVTVRPPAAVPVEPPPPAVVPPVEPAGEPAAPANAEPPVPAPVIGVTMLARATQGTVRFRVPGSASSAVLAGNPLLPVGTRFDTTAGRVRLTLAINAASDTQSGTFWGGIFTTLQGTGSALTELVLADAQVPRRTARRAAVARAAAAASKGKRSRLWGDAKGSFRTTGRNAVATVRGTRWLTEDGDDGTTVRVVSGVVNVRDDVAARTIAVAAGERYVARDACESRRSFRIRLRVPVGVTVRLATVQANGRPIAVRARDGRLTALVDLRGRPEGVQRVGITLVTTTGVRLTGTRVYRTCSGRRAGGAPPSL